MSRNISKQKTIKTKPNKVYEQNEITVKTLVGKKSARHKNVTNKGALQPSAIKVEIEILALIFISLYPTKVLMLMTEQAIAIIKNAIKNIFLLLMF